MSNTAKVSTICCMKEAMPMSNSILFPILYFLIGVVVLACAAGLTEGEEDSSNFALVCLFGWPIIAAIFLASCVIAAVCLVADAIKNRRN